ncbi:MAG TPA: SCO family protein [Kofleriaceae bacterium]|nr:SCO family protein [Kofleriaceae bacterium]
MAKDKPAATTHRRWSTVSPRELIRQRYFPDVPLVTHEGKKVRFYADLIKGRCVVMNFMYARCQGICSPITTNLLRVQAILHDRVGRDIFMYSFSLKPDEDTPEALGEYVKVRKVGPGWTFLTGKPDDLEHLRRSLGFTDPDPVRDADKTNHTGMVRYGNEALQLWAAFPGTSKAEAIAKSILWVAPPV